MNSKLQKLKNELNEAKAKEEEFRKEELKFNDLKWKEWSKQVTLRDEIKLIKIEELKGQAVNDELIAKLKEIDEERY